jgi:hypothetical protein
MNDVVKPWDDLNELLSNPFALQPDLSDITRAAHNLAVSIKHQVDYAYPTNTKAMRKAVDSASIDNRLMSDVADCWKHGRSLNDPGRNNSLQVAAMFEYAPDRGFRFLRNVIWIEHATIDKHDFIITSHAAIQYWLSIHTLIPRWTGTVAEGPAEFRKAAMLRFDPRYCIHVKDTRVLFVTRTATNDLAPVDPPEGRIEIY